MTERISHIQHQGKRITVIDYSYMTPSQVIELTHQLPEALKGEVELRLLIDTTATHGNMESMAALKDVISKAKGGGGGTQKAACIGVTGVTRFLLDSLGRVSPMPLRAFETKQEALDWLAE